MKVIKELYVIEDGGEFILYAPLKRTILSVNQDVISLLLKIRRGENFPDDEKTLRAVDSLRSLGIIDAADTYDFHSPSKDEYKPTRVTFLPTSDCNLRCIYCYANSGSTSRYLTFQVAQAALDFVFANAKEKNLPEVDIGFLGGGEPFLAWSLIKDIVAYSKVKANKLGLRTVFSAVTNGILSERKILWINENFKFLSVSLDGMKAIQDMHRPTKGTKGSYDRVINTVNFLNELGFQFSIRATVSSMSVHQMISIFEFFVNDLKIKRIHFEPLFACGRCRARSYLSPNPMVFAENLKKCIDIAHTSHTELFCSAIRLDALTDRFCGALGDNFYITPEGFVTSCTEVSSMDEPLAKIFFIGKFDEQSKNFVFWDKRRQFLSSRSIFQMENCQKCIAKWHCAGGCPAKAAYAGNLFNTIETDDCKIARELTEYYIRKLVSKQGSFLPQINTKHIEPF